MDPLKIIVTAGATREYIDSVRFISNASSGLMGCAVAAVAAAGGHDVTLLLGSAAATAAMGEALDSCSIVPFTSVSDLKDKLTELFDECDVLVMAAAVGDFRPAERLEGKIPRSGGAVTIRLEPTEDVLASVAAGKRGDQVVVAFAVEDGPHEEIQARALRKLADKNADCVVLNTPAAMGCDESEACVLTPASVLVPWARRPKSELAAEILRVVGDIASNASNKNG